MPETKSYETVSANVAKVREQMREAALRAGRDPEDVTLVAATKVQTSDTIRNAIRAGITVCGENRVQELTAHLEDNAYEGARVHFIGHLQTNKVKSVIDKTVLIHSIDSIKLSDTIDFEARKKGIQVDGLLEVNVAGEESKFGFLPEELLPLLERLRQYRNLKIRGLMTVAPMVDDAEQNRAVFRRLRELSIDIKLKNTDNVTMNILSMGMTGDYHVAIEEGATLIRVGTGIFGMREIGE